VRNYNRTVLTGE